MGADTSLLEATTALAASRTAPRVGRHLDVAQARKVAQDFEAFFLGQMLQPLFADLNAVAPFGGGPGEDIWRSMQVDEYGKALARRGGVGIADAVFNQILKLQEAKAP